MKETDHPIHLSQVFEQACAKYTSLVAIRASTGKDFVDTTYAQLHADVQAWTQFLASQGIGRGDRVAAISSKSPNHYRFFYACWRLGAIAVPICETLGNEEMSFILKDCSPKLVLAADNYLAKARETAGEIPVVDWEKLPVNTPQAPAAPQPVPCCFDDPAEALSSIAVLIYTSGSTGMPKGVMLTHENIWWNMTIALEFFEVRNDDRLISLLPYWHAYALTCEITCLVKNGATCLIAHNIADFQRNLAKFQPTLMLVVPRILDMFMAAMKKKIEAMPPKRRKLVENAIYNASRIFTAGTKWNGGLLRMLYHKCFYDPFVFKKFRQALGGKLRLFVAGGAPLDMDVQSFYTFLGIPVLQGYGLTETAPVVASNSLTDYRLGSCGKIWRWAADPAIGGDYTFKDEDGNLGKNLRGQLLVKGKCVMKGYWNHSDASAKTMENGYLNTGDVGHVDKDGYLFIHGRNSSMIVLYGGEKLHPEAIEDAVKTSELVSEAMVFGEKCKSVYVAVNVPEDVRKRFADEAELQKAVKAAVQEKTADLAAYKKPKDVIILPDFNMKDGTMTATLKIRRFKIRELYREKIEAFLQGNGEEIATKKDLFVPASRIVESLADKNDVVLGVDNTLK
ncbi:MAG: AMP-binding protein [Victivallales bacterium]|nr:AMP-binding protein [Victivallales bacterium]